MPLRFAWIREPTRSQKPTEALYKIEKEPAEKRTLIGASMTFTTPVPNN
jgi:hypothetical protein